MSGSLERTLESLLSARVGTEARIAQIKPISGGCINSAAEVRTADGRRTFVKFQDSPPPRMFSREQEGLRVLRETQSIRAPEPLLVHEPDQKADGPALLLMEFIATGSPASDFDEKFGRGLAQLHRAGADQFGFAHDNFIGSTPQPNAWRTSWVDFFREHRLLHLLRLLGTRGYATAQLREGVDKVVERLEQLLKKDNLVPSLVHGDLWSGNFLCDEAGAPVLIDPAVYYGDREVDLAMTELFGRLDAKFYAAYREAWPLESGYDDRREIYNLYHLMNHLYLFGLSYMGGVMAILRRYV